MNWCVGERVVLAILLSTLASVSGHAQTSVTTQHNDIGRTGANTSETILTPSNVNTNTFGKLFSAPVDGWIYAQPLYMPGVTMGAGTAQPNTAHNVVFVATEHDSVFAFDADSNSGANANPLWQVSLIDSAHGGTAGETTVAPADINETDIVPEVGITSTPVIDPTSNTIYVVAKSTVGGTTFLQRLHALDITTGKEKFGGPVELSGSVAGTGNGSSGGTLKWDPMWENNRASLLLLNGIVYIGFGSHNDNGPWHGWILAYNAKTLQQTGAWCSTPNVAGGGIWMGGTGLAADVPSGKPYGRLFTATGNGTFDAVAPNYTNFMDYGDSIIKLDLANGAPTMSSAGTTVGDDFTPNDQATLNNNDQDQASGGVVVLPASVGGGGDQLVQVGKSGTIYVLNRENLGGYHPNDGTDPGQAAQVNDMWGAPAYWNGNVYIWSTNNYLMAFNFANGAFTSSSPASTANQLVQFFSPTPSISANGATNGIVWSVRTDNYASEGRAILYAHEASDVANLLYSSESNVARDNPGNSVKFVVPTVVNGKVYVGTESQLSVFGLLAGATQAATPSIVPGSETFSRTIQVTITDATPGVTIYYTTDGSTPSTASTPYTNPFSVTATTTINAIAEGPATLASTVASATYTLVSEVAAPTFSPSPGYYSSAVSVAITTTTPNTTIYYTLNGTTPTTGSYVYSNPISVAATEALSAMAVDNTGVLSNSPVTSGDYNIDPAGVSSINFASGFTAGKMVLIGNASLNGSALQLTDGKTNEVSAAWYQVPASVQSFTTEFKFQITPASASIADGFTFTIQGNNTTSIGSGGGGLGYGPPVAGGTPGIGSSVAITFDTYNNAGEGSNSIGLYENGESPTTYSVDMTSSGINLHSGHVFDAHLTYDGTNLTVILIDTSTNAIFSGSVPVDIPSIVGGAVAYVGFTGSDGSGGLSSTQRILSWNFASNITPFQVQTTAKATSSSASSLSVSFPGQTNAGDVILVGFDETANISSASVTDSQGNTFTEVGKQLTSPAGRRSRVYYAKNIAGGADTIKVSLSTKATIRVYISEYSAADPSSPVDTASGATGTAGSVSSGAVSTASNNDLIYGYCAADSACTAGSGFTTRSTLDNDLVEDEPVRSAGPYAATGSATGGWTMQMVALKPPVSVQ